MILGPISSSFVNRFGCRWVTIAGAILSSICLFISAFAPNILFLMVTIGVGVGFGFGLIYLPAIVSVTMYFEKYRSLATGIAVCGSGFGTVIFSPLIDFFINEFGWRGTMVILSAIVLNCIVFGVMFRPLEPPKRQPTEDNEALDNQKKNSTLSPDKLFINNNSDNMSRSYSTNEVSVKQQVG